MRVKQSLTMASVELVEAGEVTFVEVDSIKNGRISSVSYNNMFVSTKQREKVLLNDVTGEIKAGFCAVMGASGSGKTTFLSALALRIDRSKMNVKGTFLNTIQVTSSLR